MPLHPLSIIKIFLYFFLLWDKKLVVYEGCGKMWRWSEMKVGSEVMRQTNLGTKQNFERWKSCRKLTTKSNSLLAIVLTIVSPHAETYSQISQIRGNSKPEQKSLLFLKLQCDSEGGRSTWHGFWQTRHHGQSISTPIICSKQWPTLVRLKTSICWTHHWQESIRHVGCFESILCLKLPTMTIFRLQMGHQGALQVSNKVARKVACTVTY